MAYNPHTKLLLNFEGGSLQDTSEFATPVVSSGDVGWDLAGAFGTQALALGVSGGLYEVASYSSGVFSELSSYDLSRTIDLWVKPYPENTDDKIAFLTAGGYGNSITLRVCHGSAGDVGLYVLAHAEVYVDPDWVNEEISVTYTAGAGFNNSWHHVRIYISGAFLTLGVDGTDVGTATFTTGSFNFENDGPDRSVLIGDLWNTFRGSIDAVQFLEGEDSWTGGSYTVPTAPPEDYGSISGESATETDAFTTVCNGQVIDSVEGVSETTCGEITSYGEGVALTSISGEGSNTTDTTTSTCAGMVVTNATGSVTLNNVISVGSGLSQGAGWWNTVVDVATVCSGYTVPDVFAVAAYSQSDATTVSVGHTLVTGTAGNSVDNVSSVGGTTLSFVGRGSCEVGVTSLGAGSILVKGAGTSLADVSSAGVCVIGPHGRGANVVSTVSLGQGTVLCLASGSNLVESVVGGLPRGIPLDDDLFFLTRPNNAWVTLHAASHRVYA